MEVVLCHIRERYSNISLLLLLEMNRYLGQMEDTPTWLLGLPNPSNVAAFTKTLNSYQIQVRSLVGTFQALQSLGQLTSSVTVPHCP